jgi:hypothetical protein
MTPGAMRRLGPATINIVAAVFLIAIVPLLTHSLDYEPLLLGAGCAVCAFLIVGWAQPLMVVGAFVGGWLDIGVKSGSVESQKIEWVTAVCLGAFVGLALGLAIDRDHRSGPSTPHNRKEESKHD